MKKETQIEHLKKKREINEFTHDKIGVVTITSPDDNSHLSENTRSQAPKIETSEIESKYFTNPMYKKLLQFREKQKKERFTVEDLLKW